MRYNLAINVNYVKLINSLHEYNKQFDFGQLDAITIGLQWIHDSFWLIKYLNHRVENAAAIIHSPQVSSFENRESTEDNLIL